MGKRWAREQAKTNELASAVEQAGMWLRLHPQTAVWGVIGAAAAVLLAAALINRNLKLQEETWSQLGIAQSYAYAGQPGPALEQLKNLSAAHPGSSAAGYGVLLAGDILFQQNRFDESLKTYQSLLDNPGDPGLIPLAMAGLSLSHEAKGDCQSAKGITESYLAQYEDHFMAPQVHASLARCLTILGQGDKAKATYERIEFLYPDTYWAQWAKTRKAG